MNDARVCTLCPRRCSARRLALSGTGACGMGYLPVVARAALHFDEEPCISGSRGSGAVFFSGCALGCVYCQNESISRGRFGKPISVESLRKIFGGLVAQGAHNINLVTASHFADSVAEALDAPLPVPVVYNCGGYESMESLALMEDKVQVYLPDLKYLDEAGARRYSGAPDYPDVARAAILEMYRQVGEVQLDGDGLIRRGLMIRHLILPDRAAQSMRVLHWIADSLPRGVYVSLMAQYLPCGPAKSMPELNRALSQREYDRVVDCLFRLGLENGYVQELAAADAGYIPAFDLTGVED